VINNTKTLISIINLSAPLS